MCEGTETKLTEEYTWSMVNIGDPDDIDYLENNRRVVVQDVAVEEEG